MRKFTKSLLTLALLVFAVGGAKAEKVYADLSQYGDKWDSDNLTLTFSWTAQWGNQLAPNLDAIGLPKGDLRNWQKLVVVVDELNNCDFFRVLVYSGDDANHSNTFKCTKTGANEFTLSGNVDYLNNVTRICLSGSNGDDTKKDSWAETPASFKVKQVYLERPDDPLAIPKDNLTKAIALGNAQNSFAKTAASFAVLTDAITDGVAELANVSATVESLNTATQAIKDAIAGFVLLPGYTNLTKDMYKNWDSATEPTTGTDASGACDYVLNESTSQPYGHGNVPWKSFADLSTYDTFYVLATGGTPRILLNRDTDGGQPSATESESHLIDNTNNNCMTWASGYFTTEGSNVTVNLKQLATNKGFAHLHTIKKVGADVAVSDMLLYRTITVGEEGYSTFGTLYKNAKPNGVKAYAAKVNGSKVTLTEVTNVPAGKGVVIEAAEGSYAPTFDVDADDIDTDLLVSNGTVVSDGTFYVLAKTDKNGVGFHKLTSGQKVPAGKAYLVINSNAPEFLGFGGDATGINEVKAVEAKGEFFNLAGQRVAKPAKGLYIANGKKVIIK